MAEQDKIIPFVPREQTPDNVIPIRPPDVSPNTASPRRRVLLLLNGDTDPDISAEVMKIYEQLVAHLQSPAQTTEEG